MAELETIELRLPENLTAYIDQLAKDTGVLRDDVASVLTVLALRRYLPTIPSEEQTP